ncbi:hypothetical protein K466DRAFT_79551, partial [Polyporus arcularius HHB13444]
MHTCRYREIFSTSQSLEVSKRELKLVAYYMQDPHFYGMMHLCTGFTSQSCRPSCVIVRKQYATARGEYSQIHEQLPKHREHQTLQAVREYTRLQTTAEQPKQTVLRDDGLRRRKVPDARLVHLPVGLHNTKRVRHRVGHDGRAEADECLAKQLLDKGVRLRECLVQAVVGREPWVVSDERR